ncbi:hypothetical protein Ccar_10915 [Clostridium carboxidivorans P7]|uniref:Uncharacterized protein n=1 Tax=Clostridium carboxidivorans P7 TaxID=536227 RepID=C6PYZ0_9CLOT|nr:hypothetical protein [Clostridium carboxidivorans]AKN31339.1 hypothetical protein Ccar_10915 [Clostridium carboxidivorans P7]EET85524.1 hypothetical protein CcarbDRAFT_4007 [Clostridium carboxidivorans P7]EFG88470.1 hypothetical protein CLCAR_2048 [Clostridium carboxidivorans P7]
MLINETLEKMLIKSQSSGTKLAVKCFDYTVKKIRQLKKLEIYTLIPSEVLLTKPFIVPILLTKTLTPTFSSSVPYRNVDLNQLMRL